jgi:hypothetical protein
LESLRFPEEPPDSLCAIYVIFDVPSVDMLIIIFQPEADQPQAGNKNSPFQDHVKAVQY